MSFKGLTIGIGLGLVLAQAAVAQTTGSVHGGGTRTSPFAGGGQAPATTQTAPSSGGDQGGAPPVQGDQGAQMITANDAELMTSLLQDWGYKAKLGQDDAGAPMIESAIAGVNYTIYFYGCQNETGCTSIEFSTGFNLTNGLDLATLADWHGKKRFTRVYLDQNNDPFMSMDINMYGGGMTTATFQDNVYLWESLVNDFKVHINW